MKYYLGVCLWVLACVEGGEGLTCYQCANTEGKLCPYDATTFTSSLHDACITWKLGNGSVILQNLVSAPEECTEDKIKFWTRFIDLYYNAYGGSVSCCYGDKCNNGKTAHSSFLDVNKNKLSALQGIYQTKVQLAPTSVSDVVVSSGSGSCEKYYDKIGADEWIPDILVPLAFDRASQTKVGVFYVKLGLRNNNNDHVIMRLVNRNKQNLTMYSIKFFRVGSVSVHVNKLEHQRSGNGFVQQDGKKASVNNVVNFEDDTAEHQGFWISIKDDITISVGKIGTKLIDSFLNFTDVVREGPDDPYYFGLTTPVGTSASFGVNCDMPGLHFPDTCVTDTDCEEYPLTVCGSTPVSPLDPGVRSVPFDKWSEGHTLLKSCWCKEGTVRIPESNGCYDPIRKVVTLRDACFANYHCTHLPNTVCTLDMEVPRYNMSCQCLPGHKGFEPDPRTGLVEGCAPLTTSDKGTVNGCSRRFSVQGRKEWVPETVFPIARDEARSIDVGVFFVSLGKSLESQNDGDDTAVLRLLDESKDRRKMYSIKIDRKSGKVTLHDSKITRNFFFTDDTVDNKVAEFTDYETKRRLENGHVGFWIQYKYQEGYGGTLSVGINGSPFTQEFAIVKWTDSSPGALPALRYIGFTADNKNSHIHYGANCVLLNNNINNLQQNYEAFSLEKSLGSKAEEKYSQFLERSSVPTKPKPSVNPWNYISTDASDSSVIIEPVFPPRAEQIVLEPVIKGQYLTKLKRLLPTYFNEGDNEKVLVALDKAYRSY